MRPRLLSCQQIRHNPELAPGTRRSEASRGSMPKLGPMDQARSKGFEECQRLPIIDNSARLSPMNVNLTPELEALVQRKVASGLYNNQSEVVREALRLLADQDRLREAHNEKLRGALAEGLAQADRGELLEGPDVVAEVRESLRRRKKSDKKSG